MVTVEKFPLRACVVVWLVAAAACCAHSAPASAAAPCPSRNAAAQLLAPAIARNGIAKVHGIVVGTYLLASVNAISVVGDGRCSVDFTVTLFPNALRGRPSPPANADLFKNHEPTTTIVRRRDGWHVDERNLLPWMHGSAL